MTVLTEAIQSCKAHPLHGPSGLIERWIEQALTQPVQDAWINQFLYTLNMIDSRNIPWIECVLEVARSQGV
jgi:hypothetical protein